MTLQISPQTENPQPPIQVDHLHLDAARSIYVVRDDLLPAGTKQRAILPLLKDFQKQGVRDVVYASPFAGFAQIALAYGCQAVGMRCKVYCERDPGQPGLKPHSFTLLAQQWGAEVVVVETLAEAEERSLEHAEKNGAFKIPLGFHCREFQAHFQAAVTFALGSLRRQLGFLPTRVWLPVGSGTLAQAFRKAAPPSMHLNCVDVHVLHDRDLRIQALQKLPSVSYFSAEQEFKDRATALPPVPSNLHYDAKLWAFVQSFAEDGDLWWNVAR